MDDRRAPVHLIESLIYCIPLLLLLSATPALAKSCPNKLDIVIAVDTTSSQTASDFDNVKTEVKGIVSGFTIGQSNTRLALLSISQQARVVVNFNAVNSLSEFNAAVDSLTFSTDAADLSEGIKVAKDSVLNAARVQKTSKILILVKDRRSGNAVVPATAVLSRMTSEAAAVKSLGAAIHAVGIGGLWNSLELATLFGTDHILFKDKNKAAESVKSLNNLVCSANCPNKGTSTQQVGLCYKPTKHVIETSVTVTTNSAGDTVCRKEISRKFVSCAEHQSCHAMYRKAGICDSDGKVTIENSWQSFDSKLQSCVTTATSTKVDCRDANTCSGQVADVIFMLDKSGSIGPNFPKVKQATKLLAESLNIGVNNVRIGLLTFEDTPHPAIPFGKISDKAAVLSAIDALSATIDPSVATFTNAALRMARETFRDKGRAEVPKFVFVITDGESSDPPGTFAEVAKIKNAGATLFAIGVGEANEEELKTMTAPESATNMFLATSFDNLQTWSQEFSKKLCAQMSTPHPKLCEDSISVQSISACVSGQQQVTKTEYKFNPSKKCIKASQTTVHRTCRAKCIDPIDGNEYFDGDTWTTLCHEFQCKRNTNPLVPRSSKCLAADGTCKEVGSQPFKCRDNAGVEANNCLCVDKGGKATLVIDTN